MPGRQVLSEARLPGYATDVGAALWRLEDARRRTLQTLAGVTQEMVDRETGGNTIGTVLYHVALIELDWLYAEILTEPYPDELSARFPADDRDAAGVLSVVAGESLDQLVARLADVRRLLLDRLRPMSDDDFHRLRNLPDYDVSPAWVLHHLAQHEAEHRAEIGAVVG